MPKIPPSPAPTATAKQRLPVTSDQLPVASCQLLVYLSIVYVSREWRKGTDALSIAARTVSEIYGGCEE